MYLHYLQNPLILSPVLDTLVQLCRWEAAKQLCRSFWLHLPTHSFPDYFAFVSMLCISMMSFPFQEMCFRAPMYPMTHLTHEETCANMVSAPPTQLISADNMSSVSTGMGPANSTKPLERKGQNWLHASTHSTHRQHPPKPNCWRWLLLLLLSYSELHDYTSEKRQTAVTLHSFSTYMVSSGTFCCIIHLSWLLHYMYNTSSSATFPFTTRWQ